MEVVMGMAEDVAKDTGTGGLVRATLQSCTRNDDKNIEENAERGYTKDDRRNGDVYFPEIAGERQTEKQQRGLEHQRQRLQHVFEVPRDNAIVLSLSVLSALDGRPSHAGQVISVQPLFAEHRQEGRKEGDGETGEQDDLNMNNRAGRTNPLWEGGNVVSESGVVDLVNENTEQSGRLVVGVGLELRIDFDYECGSDGRK